MSDAQSTFATKLTARDESGPAIAKLDANVTRAANHLGSLGKMTAGAFGQMKHGAVEFGGAMRETNEGVARLFEGLGSLASPMAALGGIAAAASISELFKGVEETAEHFAELEKHSKQLGLSAADLQHYQFAARATDTDVDKMTVGFAHLNAALGAAGLGHNKQLATDFHRLGISLRDAHGNLKSLGELMPDIQKAFQVNKNTDVQGYLARELFGQRAGKDMIEMLSLTSTGLSELTERAKRFEFTPNQRESLNLEEYHQSWVNLTTASEGLGQAINTALLPVLGPATGAFGDMLASAKEWVHLDLSPVVKSVAGADWSGFAGAFKDAASGAGDVLRDLGGIAAWVSEHSPLPIKLAVQAIPTGDVAGLSLLSTLGLGWLPLFHDFQSELKQQRDLSNPTGPMWPPQERRMLLEEQRHVFGPPVAPGFVPQAVPLNLDPWRSQVVTPEGRITIDINGAPPAPRPPSRNRPALRCGHASMAIPAVAWTAHADEICTTPLGFLIKETMDGQCFARSDANPDAECRREDLLRFPRDGGYQASRQDVQ